MSGWMVLLGVKRDTLPLRTLVNSPSSSSCWAPEQVSKERWDKQPILLLHSSLACSCKISGSSESCRACSCGGFLRETRHILNLGLSARISGFCAFLLAVDVKMLFILQPPELLFFFFFLNCKSHNACPCIRLSLRNVTSILFLQGPDFRQEQTSFK